MITHPKQLSEAYDFVLGFDLKFIHHLNGVPHCVLVVGRNHDVKVLLVAGDPSKDFLQTLVEGSCRGFVGWTSWIFVTHRR